MNITYQNYPEFKNSINFGKMPATYTEIVPDINKLDSYYKLYSKSDKIAQAFDKFLTVYNDVATTKDKKKKPEAPPEPKVIKGGKIPKAKFEKSIDKEKIPEKAEKTKIQTKRTVQIMPTEIALLIRVKNLIGKPKQQKDFANVHKAIQKANAERTITKDSKYAQLLNQSLDWIENCYNYMLKNEKPSESFEMKDKQLQEQIFETATGTTVSEAVKLIKAYIRLEAKPDSADNAARLLKRIKKYKTDSSNTSYSDILNSIETELVEFLNYKKGMLRIPPTTLNGLLNSLGCNCTLSDLGYIPPKGEDDFYLPGINQNYRNNNSLGNIEITPEDDYSLMNNIDNDDNNAGGDVETTPDYTGGKPLTQIKINTNTFVLPGDIGKFLGPVALDRYAVVIKSPRGGGKSRLSLMLANAFLSRFNRVDYFSLEMSAANPQIQKEYFKKYISPENAAKLIIHDEGTIEKVRRVAQQSRVVIIDSWGKLNCRAEEYGKLRESYPGTAFIVIFQNIGDGTTRGGVGSEYDCDELIQIYPGSTYRETYAQKDKSRYTDTEQQFNLFTQKLI